MPAPVSSTSQLPELAQHLTGSDAFAAAQPNRSTKKTMKPSDLESLLSRDQELLLCDVRTKIEYDNIHLKQAKNIPLDTIEGKAIENTFSPHFPDDLSVSMQPEFVLSCISSGSTSPIHG
jgi:hypothetical protein